MKSLIAGGLAVIGLGLLLSRVLAQVEPGPLPKRYQLAQNLYSERCSRCHLALPPEVFPSESWRQVLLEQSNHYGRTLPMMGSIERQLVWQYLKDYSRPLQENEEVPFVVADSRYFKALHPKVSLPSPLDASSCTQCHVNAAKGDYVVTGDE